MALTLSGTNGVVGAGFTVDASGVSVTAGVGTFSSAVIGSIGAGVSVPAAGLTGALPTISAANCTNIPAANITGTLPAISGANLTGISAGITMADSWYVSAGLDPGSGGNDITANWERGTAAEFGSIGSAMSESSGIFTFPSTGIYYISIEGGFFRTGSNAHNYVGFTLYATTDNSSYSGRSVAYQALPAQSGYTYSTTGCYTLFDVTNVSTHKVKFRTESDGSGTSAVDIGGRRFNAVFIRLGDT